MRVKVLYDFAAKPGTSELTVYQDEILTVINQDIGDGWWEGTNEHGQRGLFPAGYVEALQEGPAATDLAIEPQGQTIDHIPPQYQLNSHNPSLPQTQPQQSAEEPDWPDEDWDDDDDSGDNVTEYDHQAGKTGMYPVGTPYYGSYQAQSQAGQHSNINPKSTYPCDISAATANLSISDPKNQLTGTAAKPKKNLNRFSNFVKPGVERYILDDKTIQVQHQNMFQIRSDSDLGIIWKPSNASYSCTVSTHGKETKMKGLKTFISYDIRTSTRDIEVRRRYKHFDWLKDRLEQKFYLTPLPPLPEKQIAGRFHEDFVEHRRNLLQLWVNYVTRHPVLSQCDVWWHFITCRADSNDKGWKDGKRKAEKDELVGANFFFSVEIQPGTSPLDPIKTIKQLDNFNRFVSKFDDAVKHMYNTAVDQSKRYSSVYSKDMKKLSESIRELASAFQSGTAWRNSLGLNEAIRQTSAAYEDIGRLFEEQPKGDFEPMADLLHQYKGLLASWPEILQVHKNALNTKNEQERLLEEGKISETVMARVNQRFNLTTYTTLAEINHFHNERLDDFKLMMQSFLMQQINFYQTIAGKLQIALNKFSEA